MTFHLFNIIEVGTDIFMCFPEVWSILHKFTFWIYNFVVFNIFTKACTKTAIQFQNIVIISGRNPHICEVNDYFLPFSASGNYKSMNSLLVFACYRHPIQVTHTTHDFVSASFNSVYVFKVFLLMAEQSPSCIDSLCFAYPLISWQGWLYLETIKIMLLCDISLRVGCPQLTIHISGARMTVLETILPKSNLVKWQDYWGYPQKHGRSGYCITVKSTTPWVQLPKATSLGFP